MKRNRVLNEDQCKKYSHCKKDQFSTQVEPINQPLQLRNLLTTNKSEEELNQELIQNLISSHLNVEKQGWVESHSQNFLFVLQIMTKNFLEIAKGNQQFQSLNMEDQTLLLKTNSKLIAQLYIAKYLSGENGEDQLFGLLGPLMPYLGKILR